MRILFLSQLVPFPLDTGAKVRCYYALQHLAASHRITLVAFTRPSDPQNAIDHLRSFCEEVVTVPIRRSAARDLKSFLISLMRGTPFLIARDEVQEMRQAVARLYAAGHFDAVHADQLWMAPYALSAKEAFAPPLRVLDQHNAVYRIPERMAHQGRNLLVKLALKREARLMRHYERRTCSLFDKVVWVTREDQAAVSYKPQADDPVIPICVDPSANPLVPRDKNVRRVTFVGGLLWPPNAEGVQWFLDNVWARVLAKRPDAQFTVIGRNPSRWPRDQLPGVEFLGHVEDLQPFLQETAVFVVPLLAGGGMRVKILDAWSWGLPIVSTSIGAEGLRYQSRKDILLADSPEDFAVAVVQLLQDEAFARRLGENGRRTVELHYDWREIYPAWDIIYPM